MTIAEEARKEMAWHIRTSRLIAATIRTHADKATTKEEAERTSREQAAAYIEAASLHCERWITESLEAESMTEEEAAEARRAVADMAEELRKQAETLPSGKREQ